MALSYVISETENFYPLSVLCHESGMEIEIGENPPDGTIKMWRMDDVKTGELIASVTLQIRDHVYTLGTLAVRQDRRNEGFGKAMQAVVFEEARRIGIKEIWGSAKVPDYYYRLGWERMDWDTSPKVGVSCQSCASRGRQCFPAIIKMAL